MSFEWFVCFVCTLPTFLLSVRFCCLSFKVKFWKYLCSFVPRYGSVDWSTTRHCLKNHRYTISPIDQSNYCHWVVWSILNGILSVVVTALLFFYRLFVLTGLPQNEMTPLFFLFWLENNKSGTKRTAKVNSCLEPRSKPCLGRPFLEKKLKHICRHLNGFYLL